MQRFYPAMVTGVGGVCLTQQYYPHRVNPENTIRSSDQLDEILSRARL